MVKILRHLKPFTGIVVLVVFFLIIQSLAELYLPTLMSDVVNNGMMKGNLSYIWQYGVYMLLVTGLSGLCSVIGAYFSSQAAVGMGRDLRDKVFTRVESYSLNEIDKIGTASLITRTTNDITQVQMVVIMMMRFMITAPIMSVGGVVMALSKDKELTEILAIVIPLMVLVMVIVAKVVIPLFQSLQKKLDKVNLVLRENLTGIRVIRAFNRLKKERVRFDKANGELTDLSIKVNKIMAIVQPFMIIFMNATTLAIVWFGGLRIGNGDLEIGDMMAFLQYAMQIMFSIIMVAIMFIMIPRAQASAVRINEVLDLKPDIVDKESPATAGNMKGYVEFKDVTFSYPGSKLPAISHVSFSAKPGEITAIIGSTGSGKSSLINLIPRFYDVDGGEVLVDGVDVRDMDQKYLRKKIGFVPQTAVLFSGTIAENIRYSKEDATDDEVKHAAEVAQAMDFISEMPDGFESPIAQGGTNVSGGQKQRLSIARALLPQPEIYIFDDSFSALDFKTDAKLRAALKKETEDATVIIVAQRVSTIMDADRIIVLDDGEVVGMGTHKELLKTNKVYYEIVTSQLSEEEIA
jgi:ATP-binding cassette subfamily B multidrug efflux pump